MTCYRNKCVRELGKQARKGKRDSRMKLQERAYLSPYWSSQKHQSISEEQSSLAQGSSSQWVIDCGLPLCLGPGERRRYDLFSWKSPGGESNGPERWLLGAFSNQLTEAQLLAAASREGAHNTHYRKHLTPLL